MPISLKLQRGKNSLLTEFTLHRQSDSIWLSRDKQAGGGWGYLTHVKGGNSFTTADALRELIKVRKVMPKVEVPNEMIDRAFLMLSQLRGKQPNSEVESYRYDTFGSFWKRSCIRLC